jgi:hypothetical protein
MSVIDGGSSLIEKTKSPTSHTPKREQGKQAKKSKTNKRTNERRS